METVIFEIRLPRILAAILIGAALATAAHPFRDYSAIRWFPRKSSVSPRSGFGAALAIVISGNQAVIQITAFAIALLAVGTHG